MRLTGLPGPANIQQSIIFDGEETINWFPVLLDAGTPKSSKIALYPTPGYEVFVELGGAPVRALFAQDGRCFAVSGGGFYEIFSTQTSILRGTVAVDANPATISSNGAAGNQLFIVSGGLGYIYNKNSDAFAQITAVGFPVPVLIGEYLDSYFLGLKGDVNGSTLQFNFSELLDGQLWPALNFAMVSQSSDDLVALAVNHREIWLFGSKTTAVWTNTGDVTVFAPLSAAYLQKGCAATWTVQRIDNSIMWVGYNEHGAREVYRAQGYTPTKVSTQAVDDYLTDLPLISDAIAWVYQDRGHTFYNLYCPQSRHNWVYDVATNLWHKRAIWDQTQRRWYPDIGRCHTYEFNTHLVGDRQSGTIYSMAMPFRDSTSGNWRYGDLDLILTAGL